MRHQTSQYDVYKGPKWARLFSHEILRARSQGSPRRLGDMACGATRSLHAREPYVCVSWGFMTSSRAEDVVCRAASPHIAACASGSVCGQLSDEKATSIAMTTAYAIKRRLRKGEVCGSSALHGGSGLWCD